MENRTLQETEHKQINSSEAPEAIDTKKPRKKGIIAGTAIAAAAGVALSGALALGIGSSREVEADSENLPPAPDPTATSEVTPSIEVTDNNPEELSEDELLENFRIPAGLSDEELSVAFTKASETWNNFGTSPSLANEFLEIGQAEGRDAALRYFDEISAESTEKIVPLLFTSDAFNNGKVSEYIENRELTQAANLNLYSVTSGRQAEDLEPYKLTTELISYQNITEPEVSESQRDLYLVITQKSNTDKNRADDLGENTFGPEGLVSTLTVTFVNDGTTEKISNIEY